MPLPNRYLQIRHLIKPGDVIAFGNNALVSRIIKLITGESYSHLGIIVWADENGPMMAESTTAGHDLDDVRNEICDGVQYHYLDKSILICHQAWLVPLKDPLLPEGLIKMQEYVKSVHQQKISFDWHGMICLGLELITGLRWFTHPDFRKFFCSEFVTRCLKETGIVPEWVNPSQQTPGSVVDTPSLFGDPVILKTPEDK